jgi:hypothetical protein
MPLLETGGGASMRGVAKFLSVTLFIVGLATQAGGQEQRKLPRVDVLMSGSEASSRIQLDGLRALRSLSGEERTPPG